MNLYFIHHLIYRRFKKEYCVCIWHVIYLVYSYWMCTWIYRPFQWILLPPGGPRPTGCEPRNRTGLWLMTMSWAWGTSAGLPLLLSSRPSALSFWNSALCFVYWKCFLYKLQQVGYDFPQWEHFFRLKSELPFEWTLAQLGEKSFSTQDAPSALLVPPTILYSRSICCTTLSTFVTCAFN